MSSVHPPRHTSTTLTTLTTTDDSDHDDDSPMPADDQPWLFGLLNHAAAFGEVITENTSLGPGGTATEDECRSKCDVMRLLGNDLACVGTGRPNDDAERGSCWRHSAPHRWPNMAGLAPSSGSDEEELGGDRDRGGRSHILRESGKFSEEPREISPSVPSPPLPSPPPTPPCPLIPPEVLAEPDVPPLTPREKVALIASEFGAAAADDEVEKLLAEADASFFQDVAILGVLHLTTHRIAFHASLLSTRPDVAPSKQVLLSGSAIVRRGRLRRRKRVWMELSHDMISTFGGSAEDERIRPQRTVLLSDFRRIHALDPANPRLVIFDLARAGAPNPHAPSTAKYKKAKQKELEKDRRKEKHREKKSDKKVKDREQHGDKRMDNHHIATPMLTPLASYGGTNRHHAHSTPSLNHDADDSVDHETNRSNEKGEEKETRPHGFNSPPDSGDSDSTTDSDFVTETVEYDTEEAALSWRREVKAALYMYRSQRRTVLRPPEGGDVHDTGGMTHETNVNQGVRISIPLARIEAFQMHGWEQLATILQLDLGPQAADSTQAGGFGVGIGDLGTASCEETIAKRGPVIQRWQSPGLIGRHHHASKVEHATKNEPEGGDETIGTDRGSAKLQFALLRSCGVWAHFKEIFESAKERDRAPGRVLPEGSPGTVVDFGPLTFVEPGLDTNGANAGEVAKGSREKEVRKALGLGEEPEVWITKCSLVRVISTSGLLVVSPRFVCFWSRLIAASDIKVRFHAADVRGAAPQLPPHAHVWCRGHGLTLHVHGHGDMMFEFAHVGQRDEAVRRIGALVSVRPPPAAAVASRSSASLSSAESSSSHLASPSPPAHTRSPASSVDSGVAFGLGSDRSDAGGGVPPRRSPGSALRRSSLLASSRPSVGGHGSPASPIVAQSPVSSTPATPTASDSPDSPAPPTPTALLSPLSRTLAQLRVRTIPPAVLPRLAKPINVPSGIPFGISPRHFVCLTIGSRGDVQPYIALGRGLRIAGHRVTIVTHEEYKGWIEGWGLTHRTAGGDPGALMKLSVEHKMFSPQFFKESLAHFRTWIEQLLLDAWAQCKDAEVLVESPPAMAGVHIAEALGIPYFRAFTMPWSRTAQYPHPFISPPVEKSASFNMASYVLFDNVFWLGTSGQINRWRKKHLGLPSTDMGHMAQAKIPFVYNFSPTVVPKPLDWGDQISVSGYWFLDNPDLNWTASDSLLRFIAQARAEQKPLVYIGFGSITVPHARAMTRSIVKGVLKSDVRAILSKGWSSRMEKDEGPQVALPREVFVVDNVPHDWLFPQMNAVVHHGGAGTTGASLRAGTPTLIKPWFGDQFFWASRVQQLGAGLRVASLRSSDLADALKKATSDPKMQERAADVGERIRQEHGVPTAIKAIYTYLDRAKKNRTTLKT